MPSFHFPYLLHPIHTIRAIPYFHCDGHTLASPPSFPLYVFLSYYSTLSFYAMYIIDCMYIHVNPTLVYKTAKVRQETPFKFSCLFL